MPDGIDRDTDDDGNRIYEFTDDRCGSALSVTTVLKRELNQSLKGLYMWKQNNDGSDDAPYHQHLFWYSKQLGTLAHYRALSTLTKGLWGPEEARATQQLLQGPDRETRQEWRDDDVPTSLEAITYSVLKKRDHEGIEQRTQFSASRTLK